MRIQKIFGAVGLIVSLSMAAQAHPGHSVLDRGIGHAIQSPYHILILAAVGLGLLALSRFLNKPAFQRPSFAWEAPAWL